MREGETGALFSKEGLKQPDPEVLSTVHDLNFKIAKYKREHPEENKKIDDNRPFFTRSR